MKNLLARFVREDAGQDLIEYALLGSFVALAAYLGATFLGTNLNSWYTALAARLVRPRTICRRFRKASFPFQTPGADLGSTRRASCSMFSHATGVIGPFRAPRSAAAL